MSIKAPERIHDSTEKVSSIGKGIRNMSSDTASNRFAARMLAVFWLFVPLYAYRPKETASSILSRQPASPQSFDRDR